MDLDRVGRLWLSAFGVGPADAAILQAAVGGDPAAPGAVPGEVGGIAGVPGLLRRQGALSIDLIGGARGGRSRLGIGHRLAMGGAGGKGEGGEQGQGDPCHKATLDQPIVARNEIARLRRKGSLGPLFRRECAYMCALRNTPYESARKRRGPVRRPPTERRRGSFPGSRYISGVLARQRAEGGCRNPGCGRGDARRGCCISRTPSPGRAPWETLND